ncbi:serine O-acetyltransferase (plasmid) [Azospirillum sp. TSH58]|uniref:serine O-acetyltransferase n=1 Tax=Azospirillum sp. TSH58 TaxID=664962 RepID=UPI000D602FAC|nr:serine O-acetyltransferase [Azospirillum sp. TSH58]AWJ87849.1 serine O-acetyltransferase [Azospirillum sp. TSH58]
MGRIVTPARFAQTPANLGGFETDSDRERAALWARLRAEAEAAADGDPLLRSFIHIAVLSHDGFASALGAHLARKLGDWYIPAERLADITEQAHAGDPAIVAAAVADLTAIVTRDPAADGLLTPFLYFKGFHALQWHRVAHWLWAQGRRDLAHFLQSRVSEVFAVDIHPAVSIGRGVLIDHGTGVVIGETAVVGDDVSILQGVTLGGTGKEHGDRHPKVRDGVLLAAGAKVLGNIEVGRHAKVGAGSVVLKPVPPGATVAGVPARVVGWSTSGQAPAVEMDMSLPEPEYTI